MVLKLPVPVLLLSMFPLALGGVEQARSDVVLLNDSYLQELFNSSTGTTLNTSIYDVVNTAAATLSGGIYLYNPTADPTISGQESTGESGAVIMIVSTTIEKVSDESFEIFMYTENPTNMAIDNVTLEYDLTSGLRADYGTFSFINGYSDLVQITINGFGNRAFYWPIGTLNANSAVNTSFTARVVREEMVAYNIYSCKLTFNASSSQYGPVIATVCLNREIEETTSVVYEHGYTALTFFAAFILGVLTVSIILWFYFKKRRSKSVSPSKNNVDEEYYYEEEQENIMFERGKTIMMNENEAAKKKGHTINEYSMIGEGDSIVGVLGMKDKMQMHREIDSLDIVNTVNVDTGIEQERNDASINTTELLITGLHTNNDINKNTLDTVLGNVRQRRQHLDRQQEEDYKRELKKLYKKISAKNRALMNSLLERQRKEKKELVSKTQGLPEKERADLLNLMNEQHMSEQNAETYKLKLEQDEETEKLRKEFAIRRRMGLKEIQMQALKDVQDIGKLNDQQMKWLMSEHQNSQKALEGMYDEEISKQRMALEEKLAKRKAIAQAAETQEEDNDDILNTVAGHQIGMIEKLKKSKTINSADANQMIDQAKADMLALKERMEKDRTMKEVELHKKLSVLKKNRLNDLTKNQELEQKEYDKKCQEMQADGPLDPSEYAQGKLKLLSQQRLERNELEAQIDQENYQDLTKLRNEMLVLTEDQLKGIQQGLIAKLPKDGNADDMIRKLLQEHEREVQALRRSQEQGRQKQLATLQERLERNRAEWNQRKEAEKTEQEQLREYEENVISKLVGSQVSISDQERERILKEHEKQMVQLENNLTLNKLRQKRMIEEKLAQRRAHQMEKLQLKQHRETESQRRRMENNAEESDDESRHQQAELMKEHVEQKMAILQGRKLDWDAEMESVRLEMLKERSLALKEQEERLGALIASLQMSKAKELAKIEEQQRAIHNLKTSLIDDLNARGVLSDPETQAVIRRHQEEQEQLNQRLENQRKQQELMLRQKLQLRLEQREKSMIQVQDDELRGLVAPNKTAAKIKKMLLIHKHMVGMEKMRNQLEREISQTLEQMRYEYDILKRKAIQNQEMDFIAGLVRVASISQKELENVLRMLYPHKTEEEFQEIFSKIFDPKLTPVSEAQTKGSHLTDRIKLAQRFPPPPLQRRASQLSMNESLSSSRRVSKKNQDAFRSAREQQQYFNEEEEDGSRFRPASRQFEDHPHPKDLGRIPAQPYGEPLRGSLRRSQQNGHAFAKPIMEEDEVVSAQYVSDDYERPPGKLPPIQAKGGKKKKKHLLKKLASPRTPRNTYDDDDDML